MFVVYGRGGGGQVKKLSSFDFRARVLERKLVGGFSQPEEGLHTDFTGKVSFCFGKTFNMLIEFQVFLVKFLLSFDDLKTISVQVLLKPEKFLPNFSVDCRNNNRLLSSFYPRKHSADFPSP